jgi:hypothetical protein
MSRVYASLKCNGGNVGGSFPRFINPGDSVSFTNLNWSVETGKTVSCEICFESFGVPKPGGGMDMSAKSSKCSPAGSYTAKRSCECSDFKADDGSAYSKGPCGPNSVGVSTRSVGGSAGSCTLCKPCTYPSPEVWTPNPSTKCQGVPFTQTSRSSVVYGGTTFTNGCASKTRQATGTKDCSGPADCNDCGYQDSSHECNEGSILVPFSIAAGTDCGGRTHSGGECYRCIMCDAAGDWEPPVDPSTICVGETVTQTRRQAAAGVPCDDEVKEVQGTKQDCAATCEDCGLSSDTICGPGQTAVSTSTAPGSCNGKPWSGGSCYKCEDCVESGDWTPPVNPANVCAGTSVTQTRARTAGGTKCADAVRDVDGTKQPNWSGWSPDPSTRCGPFQQSRYDLNGCMGDQTQPATGTDCCSGTEGVWLPRSECVEPGMPFTQTFYPEDPDCPTDTRISTGSCSDGFMDLCDEGGTAEVVSIYECWICNSQDC